MTNHVTKAVIPAAGLGTRFLPATKSQPKEMLPVVDKPSIQYVVEEAVAAGLTDILIITGRGKHAIEDHFDRNFELEHYLEQSGSSTCSTRCRTSTSSPTSTTSASASRSGLGHAVGVAREHVATSPSRCCSATTSWSTTRELLRSMIDVHEREDASVLALLEVAPRGDLVVRLRRVRRPWATGCAECAASSRSRRPRMRRRTSR